jgi:hypothetical protein
MSLSFEVSQEENEPLLPSDTQIEIGPTTKFQHEQIVAKSIQVGRIFIFADFLSGCQLAIFCLLTILFARTLTDYSYTLFIVMIAGQQISQFFGIL